MRLWDGQTLEIGGGPPDFTLVFHHPAPLRDQILFRDTMCHVAEAVYRVWRLYMAACAVQFEEGGISVYQILVSKKGKGLGPAPLARRDLYS